MTNISNANEGSSVIVQVATEKVPDRIIYWKIDHVTTDDADFVETSGTVMISGSSGSFVVTLVSDGITEGEESFGIKLFCDSQYIFEIPTESNQLIVNDTSINPTPVAGYAAGGFTGSRLDTVDKFAFSNDARTTLATGLSSARYGAAGFASDVAGYAAGGDTGSRVDTVDKFAFSDDSRTTLATGLSSARYAPAGFASDVAGYAAGGFTTVHVNTVDKFVFSDDSRTTLATGLSSDRDGVAGFASPVAGYVAGGTTGSNVDTVDKFAFSDDSRTTLATGLSSARSGAAGFAG
jgi:uncharacterized membrane protein